MDSQFKLEKPYTCRFCHKPFRQSGDRDYHSDNCHKNPQNYNKDYQQCRYCKEHIPSDQMDDHCDNQCIKFKEYSSRFETNPDGQQQDVEMDGDESGGDKGRRGPGELADGWIGVPSGQDNHLEGGHPYYNHQQQQNEDTRSNLLMGNIGASNTSMIDSSIRGEGIPSTDQKAMKFLLTNRPNELNCFINSVVQIIYNIDVFRHCIIKYRQSQQVKKTGHHQILNTLCHLFEEAYQYNKQHQMGLAPVLDLKKLRMELFKHHYAEYRDFEPFNLYHKGDASEFLQVLLELTHFCLNENENKKSPDDACSKDGRLCFVHQTIKHEVVEVRTCQCNPQKQNLQKYDSNNFRQIVYSFQILQDCTEILNKNYYHQDLMNIHGKMVGLIKKSLNNLNNEYCINDDEKCLYTSTQLMTYLKQPFPEALTLNINWVSDEIEFKELVKVYMSINLKFSIDELYNIHLDGSDNTQLPQYHLKAISCFLGAHYISFVQMNEYDSLLARNKRIWRLYNDDQTEEFQNWFDVLKQMLWCKCMPTLIIYEKAQPQNRREMAQETPDWVDYSTNPDGLSRAELEELMATASENDKVMEQAQNNYVGNNYDLSINYRQSSWYDHVENYQLNTEQQDQNTKLQMSREKSKAIEPSSKMDLTKIKDELYKVKKDSQKDNIYIYQCLGKDTITGKDGCSNFIMMHQPKCPHCNIDNAYYDADLIVNEDVDKAITHQLRALTLYSKGINEKIDEQPNSNQNASDPLEDIPLQVSQIVANDPFQPLQKEDSLLPNQQLSGEQIKEEQDQLRQRYQSAYNQNVVAEEKKVIEENDDEQILVWKCQQCFIHNMFAESMERNHKCSNSTTEIGCTFNVENIPDYETALEEMSRREYKDHLKQWAIRDEKVQKIAEQLDQSDARGARQSQPAADEWVCDECNTVNRLDANDGQSHHCKGAGCAHINSNIYEILLQMREEQARPKTDLSSMFPGYKGNQSQKLSYGLSDNDHQIGISNDMKNRLSERNQDQNRNPLYDDDEFQEPTHGMYVYCSYCDKRSCPSGNPTQCMNKKCTAYSGLDIVVSALSRGRTHLKCSNCNRERHEDDIIDGLCAACHRDVFQRERFGQEPSPTMSSYICKDCRKKYSMDPLAVNRGRCEEAIDRACRIKAKNAACPASSISIATVSLTISA